MTFIFLLSHPFSLTLGCSLLGECVLLAHKIVLLFSFYVFSSQSSSPSSRASLHHVRVWVNSSTHTHMKRRKNKNLTLWLKWLMICDFREFYISITHSVIIFLSLTALLFAMFSSSILKAARSLHSPRACLKLHKGRKKIWGKERSTKDIRWRVKFGVCEKYSCIAIISKSKSHQQLTRSS